MGQKMGQKMGLILCLLALLGLGLLVTFHIEATAANDARGGQAARAMAGADKATARKDYPASQGLLIEEGFESGLVPPPGWTLLQTNPRETWEIHQADPPPYEGASAAGVHFDTELEPQDEMLLSPPFQASAAQLAFYSFGSPTWCRDGTTDHCDLEIWLVEGDWDPIDDVLVASADESWLGEFVWSPGAVDLTPYLPPGTPVRVGFYYSGLEGEQVGLDAIVISGTEVISGELSGFVLDENTAGPTCTEAWVLAEPGGYLAIADPAGFYSLELPWGLYTVTAEAAGYWPETVQVLVSDTVRATQNFLLMAPAVTSQFSATAELQGCVAIQIGTLANPGGVTMTVAVTVTPPLTDLEVYALSTQIAPSSSTPIIAHTPPNSAMPSPSTPTLLITTNAPCTPFLTDSLRLTVAQAWYLYLPIIAKGP